MNMVLFQFLLFLNFVIFFNCYFSRFSFFFSFSFYFCLFLFVLILFAFFDGLIFEYFTGKLGDRQEIVIFLTLLSQSTLTKTYKRTHLT